MTTRDAWITVLFLVMALLVLMGAAEVLARAVTGG